MRFSGFLIYNLILLMGMNGYSQTSAPPVARVKSSSTNQLVLNAIQEFPEGGGYATTGPAFARLSDAVKINSGRLMIDASNAKPSFCSSATYLVFVSVLDRLNRLGEITVTNEAMEKLLVQSQSDGVGIWGRWNANGPGTARLFHELNIGKNFSSFDEAKAGDFLKIFWNENIGSKERGHSVIYLGRSTAADGTEAVRFWSSNQGAGYGVKTVSRTKIKRALFSRLTISGDARFEALPKRDDYLAAMLKRESTPEEMARMVGASRAAGE